VSLIEQLGRRPLIREIRRRLGLRLLVGFFEVRALTPEQEALAKKFREGIASALGVPPEAIREDVVKKWIVEWTKALVSEEYLREHPELLARLEKLGVV